MTERSLHWDGASLGDADLLTVNAADGIGWRLSNEDYESPFVDRAFRSIWNGTGNRGVLSGWLNELAVAPGVGMSVDVDTGAAVIYGMPYRNTAAVNVPIPAPTLDTRYDRIVLRRDWSAQTVRITRIAGVEGGGAPAITQSPAPSGTGTYDVPLAIVEATAVPAIGAITDEREYCTFSTTFATDAFATTHFVNDTVGLSPRPTRTKKFFIGGGDLEPGVAAGRFSYANSPGVLTTAAPAWNGAANEEGWQCAGVQTMGVYGIFRIPSDCFLETYGQMTGYIWWVANANMAPPSIYIRSAYQAYSEVSGYFNDSAFSTLYNTNINQHDVVRTQAYSFGIGASATDWVINYFAWFYNTAGAEDINILGLEFEYTGYL